MITIDEQAVAPSNDVAKGRAVAIPKEGANGMDVDLLLTEGLRRLLMVTIASMRLKIIASVYRI